MDTDNDTDADQLLDPNTLFIYKIGRSFTPKSLEAVFSKHGKIKKFYVNHRDNLINYAICHFEKASSAADALSLLKNSSMEFELRQSDKKKENSPDQSKYRKNVDNKKKQNGIKRGTTKNVSIDEDEWISSTSITRPNPTVDFVHDVNNLERVHNVIKIFSEYNRCKCVTHKSDFPNIDNYSAEDLEFDYKLSAKKCHLCSEFIFVAKILNVCIDDSKLNTSPKKQLKPSLQSSNAKKDVMNTKISDNPKSVFQYFQKDITYILRLENKTLNETWIGCTLGSKFNEQYQLLLGDFSDTCNNAKKMPYDQSNDMLAISIKENEEIVWYRSLYMNKNMYALIDVGSVAKKTDIIDIIKCPKNFVEIPMFACKFKPSDKNQLFERGDFKVNIIENNENECIVRLTDETAILGSLQHWPVINRIPNESKTNETLKNRKNSSDALTQEISPNKMEKMHRSLTIENRSSVIIVHYMNSLNVMIRKADTESKREYDLLLNRIQCAGLKAEPAQKPFKTGKHVLALSNNLYYRAEIKQYRPSLSTCSVYLLDIGKHEIVHVKNLRHIDEDTFDAPQQLGCVSLKQMHKQIISEEPMEKIYKTIEPFIAEKTALICTFEGDTCYSPDGVTLIAKHSRVNLNRILSRITRPVIDYLREEKLNAYDLPLTVFSDLKLAKLDETASENNPVVLKLLDSKIETNYTIRCVVNEGKLLKKMKSLSKRINDYCKEQSEHYFPRIDEMCLVYSDHDKLWHRAAALKCDDTERVHVYFVDTGVIGNVNIIHIKKMIPEFVEALPGLASICILEDIKSDPSPDTFKKIQDQLEKKYCITATSITHVEEVYYRIKLKSEIN